MLYCSITITVLIFEFYLSRVGQTDVISVIFCYTLNIFLLFFFYHPTTVVLRSGPAQQDIKAASGPFNPCHGDPCSLCWPKIKSANCDSPPGTFRNIMLRNITVNKPKTSAGVIFGNMSNPIQNLVSVHEERSPINLHVYCRVVCFVVLTSFRILHYTTCCISLFFPFWHRHLIMYVLSIQFKMVFGVVIIFIAKGCKVVLQWVIRIQFHLVLSTERAIK